MSSYEFIILLCGLFIFSYLFDIFAKKTKVPAVLLLLATGVLLKLLADAFHFPGIDFSIILPVIGTIGLILIVLEGALELHFTPEKKKVILKSFGAAFFLLVLSSMLIGWFFVYITGAPFKTCLLNAVPYGTISSAIAIPSVANLMTSKKEFIVYESTFSDILGIMLFNFLVYNKQVSAGSFLELAAETVLILALATVFSFFLLYLLGRIQHHIKFFLILAILVLIYAVGKQFHLSTLIIILIFGLFLNNTQLFNFEWFKKFFVYPNFEKDLVQLHILTAESAFLIRTFFFVVFGFTMELSHLTDLPTIANGLGTIAVIYALRLAYLRIVAKVELKPEVFISPRGLISILLFFSIPETERLWGIGSGLLLFVILATSLIMTYGLIRVKALPDGGMPNDEMDGDEAA
ncbi:MAG: sodium:proton antiporter [Saprospiraceae bacterium]|nr:sodium:proton antiporter [Saprospiraceae bacterium]